MTCKTQVLGRAMVLALVASGAGTAVTTHSAWAEDVSTQQILRSLKGTTTRSLSGPDQSAMPDADQAFVTRMQNQKRSLSLGEREQMATIATKRPKVDLDINFNYDSAVLSPKAEPQLKSLGEALTSSDLAGSIFVLVGHTDAKGTDIYNQSLSERRAESVKRFLIAKYRIPPNKLVTTGYGKTSLKNPSDGLAAENRRVEIVNMSARRQASQ